MQRLTVTGMAAGGEAVSRDAGGRVVLVAGALPGEVVEARLARVHPNFARATLVSVLEPSADRVAAPCPHVARGCGGCGWQHISVPAQRRLKASVVTDALRRLGGVAEPDVVAGPDLPEFGYRTTLRLGVAGRPGFRRYHGHDLVEVDSCLVAHPLLSGLLSGLPAGGDFGACEEVVLRCGARTGDLLAVLSPSAAGARLPERVRVVGEDELIGGKRAWIFEEVAGVRLRVSAQSFFQASPEGAEALVGAVTASLAGAPPGPLVDAYGGTGLFGATAGAGREVTVVETSPSSAADARVNLPSARVKVVEVARWRPSPAAVVVADPPRGGLGRRAAATLAGTGAGHLVLISCDAASLGRDTALLAGEGFDLGRTTVVDMFPGTSHVETVSSFARR